MGIVKQMAVPTRKPDGDGPEKRWKAGRVPVAVVMITLNEGHNLAAVLKNLSGWAQEVFIVDSCSVDDTVDIALAHGVHIVQRRFRGFGDQWNFALSRLPLTAPWTMKLDPDERLTDALKDSVEAMVTASGAGGLDGILMDRRLWFMGKVLPVRQTILRVWRTGACRFTDVAVNEHPMVSGTLGKASGYLEHHDSPDLDHWVVKQNRYTTAEAVSQFRQQALAAPARLFGSSLERRMWIKRHFWKFPGRYAILYLYHLAVLGAWRAGRVGWIWSHLRTEVYRLWEYKRFEIERTGALPIKVPSQAGQADPRVSFHEE